MGTHKVIVLATTTTEQNHQVINTTGLTDPNLSWKAKGMHAHIRTNGGGWLKNQDGLVGASKDGRDSVRAGIKELVERKYLHRATVKNDRGQISYHAYISTPTPIELTIDQIQAIINGEQVPQPEPDYPAPGNPFVGSENLRSGGDDIINNYPSANNNNIYINNKHYYPSGNTTMLCKSGDLYPKINKIITELTEFWNSLPKTPTHTFRQPPTKTQTKNIIARQKAIKRHSPMVIKRAMEVYSELLSAKYTLPMDAAPYRVPLYEFFNFTDRSIGMITNTKKHPLAKVENWFYECHSNIDDLIQLFSLYRKDVNPEITKLVGDAWSGIFDYAGTAQEKNQIRLAGEKYADFFHANKHRFADQRRALHPAKMAQWFTQYLQTWADSGKTPHTGWLVSDITWAQFARYLKSIAVITDDRTAQRRASHGAT